MKKPPALQLQKTILQVRYPAKLGFYDLLIPAAQRMSEYPHWGTNTLRVVLRDFDTHCSLAIEHNAFGYEQDSADTEIEKTNIGRALTELPGALDIESFIRLGYRRQYLIPVEMPVESLVSVLNVKLFSQDDRLRRIMPAQVSDLMYRIDSAEHAYKYHFTVGPVQKQEIPRYVTFNRENHLDPEKGEEVYQAIVAEYPDVAVFADIDLYQVAELIPVQDAQAFVDTARERIHDILSGLSEYLFSGKLED